MSISQSDNVVFNHWGEFLSPECESRFQAYKWSSISRRIEFVCRWTAITYFIGIWVDLIDNNLNITMEFEIMASLRFIIFLAGMLLSRYISNRKDHPDFTSILAGYLLLFGITESVSVVIALRIRDQ